MSEVKQAVLFASDAMGIYIPQHFAESHSSDYWQGMSSEDLAILLDGPDHEFYWDAWDSILNNAETIDGGILHQDGDLWVVWPQPAIDAVNTLCEDQLEYEESHEDAGDNYAHMVSESWCVEQENRLLEQLTGPERYTGKDFDANGNFWPQWEPLWQIDPMGLSPEELSEIALDLFTMKRGSIHGSFTDGIVLDSYAIQEIEIYLGQLAIDGITMDLISESCEAYISGTDLAYMTSDSVWYAVVDPVEFQAAIATYKDS